MDVNKNQNKRKKKINISDCEIRMLKKLRPKSQKNYLKR